MRSGWAIAAALGVTGTAVAAQAPAPPQAAPVQQVPTRVSAAMLTGLCGEDRSACLTYIIGAADAFSSALAALGSPPAFCVPRGATNEQIALAAVTYLRAHPEQGQANGALVVLEGLRANYPCAA